MKFTYAPEMRPLAGFTIKRAIDRGGFGEVYYALSDSGKEVALKVLQHNADVELRGIAQCLNLKHPNLVTLFDVRNDAEGQPWVVMEYVSGKSLEQTLAAAPQGMSLEEIDRWFPQMCAGAAYLHDRGIVHRDLKPANIFSEQGIVKIGDVGLAKLISPSHRSVQTESVGTVYYMAPEVARGKYGSEIDVYSLGVMLYEMLSGQVPFGDETTGEILMKHLTERPDLNKVALPFRQLLSRALAKDPAQRTPSAAELAKEFKAARQGKEVAYELTSADMVNRPQAQGPVFGATPPNRSPHNAQQSAPRTGPSAQRTPSHPNSRGVHQPEGFPGREFRIFLIVATCCFLAGRELRLSLMEILIISGFLATAIWGARAFFGGISALFNLPQVPKASSPGRRVVPQTPYNRGRPVPSYFTPDTHRVIPLTQRVTDLTTSMTKAALWTVVVSLAVATVTPVLAGTSPDRVQSLWNDPSQFGLFAFTTLIASWTLLLPTKLMFEGNDTPKSARRLIQTALGAGVGACAFWAHDLLLVDSMSAGNNALRPSMFQQIGFQSLATPELTPTLAGYVVFFSLLFGLRRWWWRADSYRTKSFSIGSILLTTVLGFFIPAFFAFPQDWGTAWAGAIALVVQLSSGWIAPDQRDVAHSAQVGGV